MHDGHRRLVVVDRVLDGLAHQALGALLGNRLDADARGIRETDLLHAHFVLQEGDQLLGLVAFRFPLNAGVDVFRILAEDHHVDLLRLAHRRGHALEVRNRAQADVQVQLLAQRNVERADAAANRRGQRALDGHHVILQDFESFFRQPHVGAIHLGRFLAGIDLHPGDLALAAVGLGHGCVDHLDHHRGDIQARTVAFDEWNDRIVRNIQRKILVDRDLFAGRNLDVLIHDVSSTERGVATSRRIRDLAARFGWRAGILTAIGAGGCRSAPRSDCPAMRHTHTGLI